MHNLDATYKQWVADLKEKVRSAQLKAAVSVNSHLIQLYWDFGKMITEKQTAWGTGFLQQLAKDLIAEFPDINGFSLRNLKYCRYFFQFYSNVIGQQAVAQIVKTPLADLQGEQLLNQLFVTQIPWGHNILIFTKSTSFGESQFYIQQTIQNGWSRSTLALQLKTKLYERAGKAVNNFSQTLAPSQSE